MKLRRTFSRCGVSVVRCMQCGSDVFMLRRRLRRNVKTMQCFYCGVEGAQGGRLPRFMPYRRRGFVLYRPGVLRKAREAAIESVKEDAIPGYKKLKEVLAGIYKESEEEEKK